MKPYLFKTPRIIERLFPVLEWKIEREQQGVYLTFDDGPTPEVTSYVLEQLQAHQAEATFFCIGKNIRNHPDQFADILARGHRIGNHTLNHLNASKTDPKTYLNEVMDTQSIIEQFSPTPSSLLFRPPYGRINGKITSLLQEKNFRIIMWSLLSADFDKNLNHAKSLKNLKENTKPGSIIVFHDSRKAYDNLKKILPPYLEFLSESGFKMKKL